MNTDPQLRGDYTHAGPDYSVEQDWSAYTREDHALFRRLYEHQSKLVARYACPEWIEAVNALDAGREIPNFDDINRGLAKATDYRIDRYQDTYFVIDSFDQLMRETAPDFTPVYARVKALPTLDPS